jgi:hypothetical protein
VERFQKFTSDIVLDPIIAKVCPLFRFDFCYLTLTAGAHEFMEENKNIGKIILSVK